MPSELRMLKFVQQSLNILPTFLREGSLESLYHYLDILVNIDILNVRQSNNTAHICIIYFKCTNECAYSFLFRLESGPVELKKEVKPV